MATLHHTHYCLDTFCANINALNNMIAECLERVLSWWGVAPTFVPLRNAIKVVACAQTSISLRNAIKRSCFQKVVYTYA